MDARRGEAEDDVAGRHLRRRSAPRPARPRRRRSRPGRNRPRHTFPASPPSRRRSGRSRPGGSPRRSTAITRSAIAAVEPPGREIIEEEERLGALDDEVVGAHRDEVDADAVVAVEVDGELQLGADAVIGGDQQRIAIARRLEVEEAAEAAQRGVGARPRGRFGERRDRLDQRIAGGDRNAGFGISVVSPARSAQPFDRRRLDHSLGRATGLEARAF